jgi:hypothetical protein
MDVLKFKHKAIFFFTCCLLSSGPGLASGYLDKRQLQELEFYCISDYLKVFSCGKLDSSSKSGIIKLKVFKSIITTDGVHAFRIMPSFTNLTGETLIGVQFEFTFNNKNTLQQKLNYSGIVRNKMDTSTDTSFLIRSDIPIYSDFYESLSEAYYSRNLGAMNIGISNVKFSN